MRALWGLILMVWLGWGAAATVSPAFHDALAEVQRQQAQGHYGASLQRLQRLRRQARSGLERALVQTYLAYAYLGLDRLDRAAAAARQALKRPELPAGLRHPIALLLGQIELQRERPDQALRWLEQALQERPDPQTRYLLAYAHYRLGHYRQAIAQLRQALKTHPDAPEDWRRLLLACYLEAKRYGEAETLLRALLRRHPGDAALWQRLAALAIARGRDHQALAALVLAWHAGDLSRDTLLAIVRLHARVGIPEKAARLVRRWRREGRLDDDLRTLRLEAGLWLAARERERALPVLERIARRSGQGKDWLAAARTAAELEDWRAVRRAARQALRTGIAEAAEAHLWLGVAAYHLGDAATARKALTRARRSNKTTRLAAYWLGCVAGEYRCP